MDWGALMQGLGGAAEGGLEGYTWGKKFEQDDRALAQKAEIAKLQAEVRTMLETLKEGGRNERAAANNETRSTIAEMNADVRRDAEAGRNRRFESGITSRGLWQEMQDRTRRRGQDMRDETTRRGQDFSSSTTRRGQDMRDETTRRGQDFSLYSDVMGDATTRRGQDEATTRARERAAAGSGGGLPPVAETVPEQDPEAAARAVLAQQLRAAIAAVKNAKTPEDAARARQNLARLRAQVKQ